MPRIIRSSAVMLLLFTLLTGVIYPLFITGAAQLMFPKQSNGGLIYMDENIVGSKLIGQQFDQPEYFWGRLSATSEFPYNASASGGSNFGVLNPNLEIQVANRIDELKLADPTNTDPVPVDLVTASASGLDPNISLAAAEYQANRVASARNMDIATVMQLIDQNAKPRWLGIFGEPVVNVLMLNLALDALQ
jgi:potassium-transporting ATPase KdpC subunit